MNVLLFGATGMVGQGVLRESLLDPGVKRVVTVGRRTTGEKHPRLQEIVVPDVADLSSVENDLAGFDACFFCLGVSSAGMSEQDYTALTYDLTLSVAGTLVRLNPDMTFIYVSGQGTDGSEKGGVMWARIKGKTENALMRLPFRGSYMFRPGGIVPMHGIRSRTPWVQTLLTLTKPLHPTLKKLFPRHITTTEELGRAMIRVARNGHEKRVLETADIAETGRSENRPD